MGIQTDSTPLEEPKDPNTCNVFNLYKIMASKEQIAEMRSNYEGGNYGYGHAKQALYELIVDRFQAEREKYHYYMENPAKIEEALQVGAKKAHETADKVLARVREKLGY